MPRYFLPVSILNRAFRGFLGKILLPGLFTIWGGISGVFAQSTFLPLNEDVYDLIDRYEVRSGRINSHLFTAIKPYSREAAVRFFQSLDSAGLLDRPADRFNRDYLFTESREWTGMPADSFRTSRRTFYRYRPDFYAATLAESGQKQGSTLDLHVNPVLYGMAGRDNGLSDPVYYNVRGAELRATIDDKVGIYTFVSENQARLPGYVQNSIDPYRVIPHETLWKDYTNGGVDFLQARGYIAFRATRHIAIQFGHDRNFIGNGYRSMILSDYSAPYLFLKADLQIRKFRYQYMLSRLNADIFTSPSGTLIKGRYPQKFFAFHHASINLGKKVNLGVFESVIFSPRDSTKRNYFDMGYLNPVIFYRAVEQQFGSPDNVILGLDGKWIIRKGLTAYGQLTIDELVVSKALSGDGWWGNKFGYQAGLRAVDVLGVRNLDVQAEWNSARPYTYSQSGRYIDYTHYRQPLAHPVGANFREAICIVRYQPIPRLQLQLKFIRYIHGKDGDNENWGGDILKENDVNRMQDTGNKTGQGQRNTVQFADLTASWMLRHNLFIDARHLIRNSSGDLPGDDRQTQLTSLALRLNMARRNYDY